MERFIPELQREIKSELLHSHIMRMLYSSDASMYQIEPLAVLLPRSKAELVHALEISSEFLVPVIARGAATNVTGSCLGKGLIVDCSKYLNKVLEINLTAAYAVVQPGVILDHLNDLVAPHGLRVGPDTSTSNRATIGGMAATNASGAHSIKYGRMQENVEEIELILWNGEVIRFGRLTKDEFKNKLTLKDTEGKIYRSLERIRREYSKDIKENFPKLSRRASGYNLDELMHEEHFNIAPLICGTEGTFGIISEIKIKLWKKEEHKILVVMGFSDLISALELVPELMQHEPLALELIDDQIINAGRLHPAMRSKLDWLENRPVQALILMEFEGPYHEKLLEKAKAVKIPTSSFTSILVDSQAIHNAWDLRKSGLGLLLSRRSASRVVAFIEDVAVPIEKLSHFIKRFQELLKKHNKEAGIFGHIGAGCIHIRPYFDLEKDSERMLMQQMMQEVQTIVQEYDGVLSGEHGDGLVRSWTNPEFFGPRIYKAFQKVKLAFDPYNLMNPGKIVAIEQSVLQPLLENTRLSPHMPAQKLSTYFDFSKEGGLALAVDMCNGNGQCRKKEGVMCPSFQVTHDEKESTRARANLLRDFVHGKITKKELYDTGFSEVLDLCLMCKGCKSECPSQVDMAKLKSEFLYMQHTHKKHSLREWIFAHIGTLFSLASPLSWLARVLQNSSITRKWMHTIGIASDRPLPQLAKKRFSTLFKKTASYKNSLQSNKQVLLFIDTFTEFTHPNIGMSAVSVLEALGMKVIAPSWSCCGRTLISKGYLPEAKEKLTILIDRLYPYAKEGIQIVGLEPSCLLTLVDEAQSLHLDVEKATTVANMSILIDEFLIHSADELANLCTPYQGDLLVHGHCHQKALVGMKAQLALLRKVVSGKVTEIPSGCCGMAGSFGMEVEHASFSKKIGELVLFPAIRHAKTNTKILSSGTSCRAQIDDGTEKKALHPIEFLAQQLRVKN